MSSYKLFESPFGFNFRAMRSKDARAFFDYFMEQLSVRVGILEQEVRRDPRCRDWSADYLPASLHVLGQWFASHVATRPSTDEEIEAIYANAPDWFRAVKVDDFDLSIQTYSLVIDVGMYLCECLRRNVPGLHWERVAKPKSAAAYNRPALVGFSHKRVFEPIGMLSTLAFGIVRGRKGPTDLRKLYDIWSEMVAG